MTHTQTVMLRLLTMCIPFRNLRKKWRTFLRDFLSDYDRDARRSMRAWRRHPVAGRTILILEPNYCHGEVIPGFCRHLLDMGYRVDVLMHHSLARQSPLCCFKEGDIHIFTAMCTSWKRLAKARVLTRYEAILISTSAFYDIPGWASFLHMTGLDKFANLLAVEHELKDIPRFGEEDFPEAYRNLGKQVLRRLPFGQTWVRRRSGKIHRLLEKRRKRRKERMLARWRTLAAPPHYREETDWITAIHSEKGQARIPLIGDSVMRHLWRPLASELQEDIDLFSSTLIPGDPDYLPTLAGYFPSAGYEAVIVSFGSHVTNKVSAISVDDFRKNYMAFVSQLSKRCRFLILATSTSIMDGPDGTLNEEKEKIITAFNAIVRETASSLPGAVLSDHHDFMQGRRYIDPFHFSPPDRAYQAGKTAGLLLPLLSARQEPPKEQECPQSRPEP